MCLAELAAETSYLKKYIKQFAGSIDSFVSACLAHQFFFFFLALQTVWSLFSKVPPHSTSQGIGGILTVRRADHFFLLMHH